MKLQARKGLNQGGNRNTGHATIYKAPLKPQTPQKDVSTRPNLKNPDTPIACCLACRREVAVKLNNTLRVHRIGTSTLYAYPCRGAESGRYLSKTERRELGLPT